MVDNMPNEFYRGISSQDMISKEGYPTEAAFQFEQYDELKRKDSFCEMSVNWNDDEGALRTLLSQHKPNSDSPQFKIGYCTIQKNNMKLFLKAYLKDNVFSYERSPIKANVEMDICDNPYHGNLLLKNDVSKSIRKNVQCALATIASDTFVKRD